MRRVFKVIRLVVAGLIGANVAFALVISFPGWAFAHTGGTERLRIHSPDALPDEAAAFAARIMAQLDQSALPAPDVPIDVYITGQGWRETLFFAAAPGAGGLVYAIGPGNIVFLSGADIPGNRLLKGDVVITPPRTLDYYMIHEIAHISQIDRYGVVGFLRLPREIREGAADHLALGPAGAALRADVAGRSPDAPHLDLMKKHGAYPFYRLQVTDLAPDGDVVGLMDRTLGK